MTSLFSGRMPKNDENIGSDEIIMSEGLYEHPGSRGISYRPDVLCARSKTGGKAH
jgi:hypothetical protein